MVLAIVFFGGAAFFGLVMAVSLVRAGRNPPVFLAVIHGAFAAAGFAALVVEAVGAESPGSALSALALLAFPALAGAYLASVHARGRTLSLQHVLIHALFAVLAYGGLIALTVARG